MAMLNYHSNLRLTQDQQNAIGAIEDFLQSNDDVFILTGYAGTGKTTILEGIIDFLRGKERHVEALAPTGRAAKILRSKTGSGKTIHKAIFNFEALKSLKEIDDTEESQIHYYFPVDTCEYWDAVYIIDESSMVGNTASNNELFTFGSGKLLEDLLSFAQPTARNNKLIFVGDPAQLPPITDKYSMALKKSFFIEKGFTVRSSELQEVVRQNESSSILSNAHYIRQQLADSVRTEYKLTADQNGFFSSGINELPHMFVNEQNQPQAEKSVVITYSNRTALRHNLDIRSVLWGDRQEMQAGDLVMIGNNNYHTYEASIFNGDSAVILEVGHTVETRSVKLKTRNGNSTIEKEILLQFRDVVLQLPDSPNPISCKIHEGLLLSPEADLSYDQSRALYVDFIIRNRKVNPNFKPGTEDYKNAIVKDKYYNALKVKYGYAITCHKAQGGEWDKVYVDFSGRIGLSDDHLRWGYTAITRASSKLVAYNIPTITGFSRLKFSAIGKISTPSSVALSFGKIPKTPFHTQSSHPAKRAKYFEIEQKLKDGRYAIKAVKSFDYQEVYTIHDGTKDVQIESYHNAAGFFQRFDYKSPDPFINELIDIINTPVNWEYDINYIPTDSKLAQLYQRVQMSSEACGIVITNVSEEFEKNFVTYYLQTSGSFSSIQFYWNKKGFSSALPKSDLGTEDKKLTELITQLS